MPAVTVAAAMGAAVPGISTAAPAVRGIIAAETGTARGRSLPVLLMAAIRKGTAIPGIPADRMAGVIRNAMKAGGDSPAVLTGPAGALTSVSAGTIRAGSHPQITIQGAGILTVRCLIHRRIPILTGAPANLKCLKAWNGRCCRGMKKSV